MDPPLPRQGTGPECRATALHQSGVGVLTLRCALDPGPSGELGGGAQLVFSPRDGHGDYSYPLHRLAAEDAAVFEAEIPLWRADQTLLGTGVWDLGVRLETHPTPAPLLAPSHGKGKWPAIMVPVPDGPYTVSPSAEHGAMTVRVARAKQYVEVDRVEVGGAALQLDAHLVPGVTQGAGEGQLVLQSRQRQQGVVPLPAELTGGQLRAVVDLDTLPSEDREDWDFYLRLDGETELRLGSHLDDIHNKREVFSFPYRRVERSGKDLTFEPFYTVDNDLSLRARPVQASPRGETPPASQRRPAARRRPLGRLAKTLTGVVLTLVEAAGRMRGARPSPAAGRRRVYFLLHNAFADGGINRTVLNLAKHLARDHEVEIISVVRTQQQPFFEIDPRVKLTPLLDEVSLRESPQRGVKHRLRRALNARVSWMVHEEDVFFGRYSLWLDLKLLQRLQTLRPGVLVSTRVSLNVIAARFARPGVVTIGQEHLNITSHKPGLLRQVLNHSRKLDALAVLTTGDQRDYRQSLAGARTRVVCIPNALPEKPAVRADLDSKRVVAAGRYTRQKGFDLLVPAFEQVARKHPDWQLRVYGGGPLHDSLRRQVRDLGLHNHVLLMGRTDQLADEFARSSLYVLSSRFEGFPMVLLEAIAVGLPVVSFDCPRGPSDLITDGVDGTLVPFGDVDALAAAILDLIENPDKRRAYSDAALKTARTYEIDVIGQAWRRVFGELLGHGSASR